MVPPTYNPSTWGWRRENQELKTGLGWLHNEVKANLSYRNSKNKRENRESSWLRPIIFALERLKQVQWGQPGLTVNCIRGYSHQCDRKKALSSPWIQSETVVHGIAPPTFSLDQTFLETTAAILKSLLGDNKSSQTDNEATYQNPVLHLHMILHHSCISRSCLRKLHLLYDPLTGPGRFQQVSLQAQGLLKTLLKHGGSCAWGVMNKHVCTDDRSKIRSHPIYLVYRGNLPEHEWPQSSFITSKAPQPLPQHRWWLISAASLEHLLFSALRQLHGRVFSPSQFGAYRTWRRGVWLS